MSKTIRVTEHTWDRLSALRDWQESFDHVITRLLDIHDTVSKIEPLIAGQRAFIEEKIARDKAAAAQKP